MKGNQIMFYIGYVSIVHCFLNFGWLDKKFKIKGCQTRNLSSNHRIKIVVQ